MITLFAIDPNEDPIGLYWLVAIALIVWAIACTLISINEWRANRRERRRLLKRSRTNGRR